MPESTTFSQSSTPTPYNGSNSVVTSSDGRWNQVENNNVLQNATPVEWNALPPQNIAPPAAVPVTASSDYHVTSSVSNVNVFNNQLAYNPPNYVNIPYPRNTMPIGYSTLNPTRGINAHIMHGPNVIRMPNGPAIGGSPWPNQAALGRYISQTPAWSSTKTTGGVKKQKRIRTAFTSQQMMELEQEYARTRYLDRARRIELAEILRLNERTIKIWFQNRRMKEKKDRAESLEDSEEASTSESSPEMGHIQIPMAIHEQYPNIKNDVYEQGNVFVEQYPVVSTQVSMPVTSLSTSMPPVYVQAPNMYQNFIPEQECPAQYQQVHLQVQPYPSPYTEAQEMPLEVVPKTEPPTPSSNSNIIEKSWDLSWIKTIEYEEDY